MGRELSPKLEFDEKGLCKRELRIDFLFMLTVFS